MSAFDAVDLFAGPGGWDVAARAMGLRVVGLELDAAACATRAAAGHPTIRCDVAQYPTGTFTGVRGLIGSPPCQGFSAQGERGGLADMALAQQLVHDLAHGRDTRPAIANACTDARTVLVAEPMRYAAALRPEWIALEQVPAVLPIWRLYARLLRRWGYGAWAGEVQAADYGVPQTRRRAVLVASRVGVATGPQPTHAQHPAVDLFGESLPAWRVMGDVVDRGESFTVVSNYGTGGDPKARGRRHHTQPAATLTGKWRRNRLVADDGRDLPRLTDSEAGQLQGFPGDYPWRGRDTALQIGNAVPPPLAGAIVAAATGSSAPALGLKRVA